MKWWIITENESEKMNLFKLISLSTGGSSGMLQSIFALILQRNVVDLFTLMSSLFVMKPILPALSKLKYGSANA